MSRNLLSTSCVECNADRVTRSKLIGAPLEFRKYYNEPPVPGVPWTCSACNTKYFVILSFNHSGFDELDLSYYESFNDEPDREWIEESIPRHWYDGQ